VRQFGQLVELQCLQFITPTIRFRLMRNQKIRLPQGEPRVRSLKVESWLLILEGFASQFHLHRLSTQVEDLGLHQKIEIMVPATGFANIVPGVFTPVLAKHTKSFNLIDMLSVGVDRIQLNFEPLQRQVETWRKTQITDETA
jgi:hypothetical protein